MKYLMLIRMSEKYRNEPLPEGLMGDMGKFVEEGFTKGWLKQTAGLKPSEQGHRIRLSGGKLKTTDGPFTEAKEVIGGFAIVEVNSEAEAREIGHRFMELHRIHWPALEAESEIRPMEDF